MGCPRSDNPFLTWPLGPRQASVASLGCRHPRLAVAWGLALLTALLLGCDVSSFEQGAPEPATTESARREPAPEAATSDDVAAAPLRIVAFGDSLTAGHGVTPGRTYPSLLQRRLDRAGYEAEVINAGVSGETTAGGLRRVDWVLKSRPDLVILELGGNDGLRGLPARQTRANLEGIIERLRDAGVPVVLVGMKLPPNYGRQFTEEFARIYPELARRYELPFMPFFLEDVAMRDRLMQADGIHPTGTGYEVIVENLLPILEPVLAELAAERSESPARS